MATIVVKDLPENTDLDREAMQAITGGARLRGRPAAYIRAISRSRPMPEPARDFLSRPQDLKRRFIKSTLFG